MKTILKSAALSLLLISCSTHRSAIEKIDREKNSDNSGIYLVDYDAIRRGTLILNDGKGRIRFVAEPPPDAAVRVSNNLKNTISYKGAKDSLSNQYTEIS